MSNSTNPSQQSSDDFRERMEEFKRIIQLKEILEKPKQPKKLDKEYKDFEEEEKKSEIERYKIDTELRKSLAKWSFWIITSWIIGVIVVLMLNSHCFCLSDDVLKVILITTTANILGLPIIVLRNLFPLKENKE